MVCPRCQTENPPQAKFCLECAAPLAARCANCGTQLPASAKFCLECAHPVTGATAGPPRFAAPESYTPKHLADKILTSKAALEGERKQVTVLFADLKGSMELLADDSQLRLDTLPAESAADLLAALLGPDPGLAPLTQMLVKPGQPVLSGGDRTDAGGGRGPPPMALPGGP